jgi:alkyldihydroxyacetonephosphate synthase
VSEPRTDLRWNGWGFEGEGPGLSGRAEAALLSGLTRRLGRRPLQAFDPMPLETMRVPSVRLDASVLARLRAACGERAVRVSDLERVTHSLGRGLPDLLRLRSGDLPALCDAVVYPVDEGAVIAVLRVAADAKLAVVPVGGGTGEQGALGPRPSPEHRGAIALDTTHLAGVLRLDAVSRTVTVQAGVACTSLEAALREEGFSLGHLAEPLEHATVGGWIAGSSGGVAGRLVAARVVTPSGVIRARAGEAAGPDWSTLVIGSEGTLGVVVEATLRIVPAPVVDAAFGVRFRSFETGCVALREMAQEGPPVSVLHLSDSAETALADELRTGTGARLRRALAGQLGFGPDGCALVCAHQAHSAESARASLRQVRRIARRHAALSEGRAPGRRWQRGRLRFGYLRDWLLDHDVALDRFEVKVPWARLRDAHESLRRDLGAALESQAGGGEAVGHAREVRSEGATLGFMLLYAVDRTRALKQWADVRDAAERSARAVGGAVARHHELDDGRPDGTAGAAALRALRERVDPAGILNPGRLP